MRLICFLLLPGVMGLAICGCKKTELASGITNTTEVSGLALTVEVPKRIFTVGEQFTLAITASNTTKEPIEIVATNSALVYVRILRYNGVAWREVKRYPETSAMVISPWTLPKRATRRFDMQLTVEPDWPMGENVRITAELNGRPEVSAGLSIEIVPRRQKVSSLAPPL